MTTFKEIGEYLDKLHVDGKADIMRKIVEDLIMPQINSKLEVKWSRCTPKVNFNCIKLTKENIRSIKEWLLDDGGFEDVAVKDFGLTTEHGNIYWTDWIVLEPGNAVVFYDNDTFRKDFLVILLKNDEM